MDFVESSTPAMLAELSGAVEAAVARAGEMWKLFRWTKKYFDDPATKPVQPGPKTFELTATEKLDAEMSS